MADVRADGHYVTPGTVYEPEDFGLETEREVKLYMEAVAPYQAPEPYSDTIYVKLQIDPDGPHEPTGFITFDQIMVSSVKIDLDIDSDNYNGLEQNQIEDQREHVNQPADVPHYYGKVIPVNERDQDVDKMVDFADGYTASASDYTGTVTILDDDGTTIASSRNADVLSTGQVPATVSGGDVIADVHEGGVDLAIMSGVSEFAPVYVDSDGAYPIAVLDVKFPTDPAPGDALTAKFRFADLALQTFYHDLADYNSGTGARFAFQADASNLPTGHYDYDVEFTSSTFVRTFRAAAEVVNRLDSDSGVTNHFHSGWWVPQLDGVVMADGFTAADGTNAEDDDKAYCYNSPANATDPSGQFVVSDTTLLVCGLIGLNAWIWGNNAVMADAVVHDRPIDPANTPYSSEYWEGAAVCTTLGVAAPVVVAAAPTWVVGVGAVGLGSCGAYHEGGAAIDHFRQGNYFQSTFHTAMAGLSAYVGYGGARLLSARGGALVPRPQSNGTRQSATMEELLASRSITVGLTPRPIISQSVAGLGIDTATGAALTSQSLAAVCARRYLATWQDSETGGRCVGPPPHYRERVRWSKRMVEHSSCPISRPTSGGHSSGR